MKICVRDIVPFLFTLSIHAQTKKKGTSALNLHWIVNNMKHEKKIYIGNEWWILLCDADYCIMQFQ